MKIIKTGQSARDALKKGIDLAVNCIKTTLGPSGSNAVLGRIDITPYITNDGVSVAAHIEAEDELENQGVWIVKEACSVAAKKGGDGTTATAVLLQSITDEVFDRLKDDGSMISKKPNVIQLKKEIDVACEEVVKALVARPITDDEIYNVALTAGEFPWLATMVTEVFKKIGKDGYVKIEEANKTSYQVFKGIELPAGYHSEYYSTREDNVCAITDPYILVTNQPLDANVPLTNLIIELAKEADGKDTGLIIVAPDFSRDLLNRLATTKNKAGYTAVALKVPTYGDDDLLRDVAALTQAKFLDKANYLNYEKLLEDMKKVNLGKAESAEITPSNAVITGGEGDTSDRIAKIKKLIDEAQSVFDKDNYEKRLAYLSGGIASIKIGAESDFEKTYFKLKAENAFNSAQNALKNGVVKGGGLALKEVSELLPKNILTKAILAPYQQIQANAGGHIDIPDSIIDPVNVTVSSLRSACSLAGMVITTEVLVAFKNDNQD